MAQLVLIDIGTLNILINETYDVVAIHEDDVELSGRGYETFRIVRINGLTMAQINEIFQDSNALRFLAASTRP